MELGTRDLYKKAAERLLERMPREREPDICRELEEKYLGETRHIPDDKYFRMLLAGMTKKEASEYTKEKLRRLKRKPRVD